MGLRITWLAIGLWIAACVSFVAFSVVLGLYLEEDVPQERRPSGRRPHVPRQMKVSYVPGQCVPPDPNGFLNWWSESEPLERVREGFKGSPLRLVPSRGASNPGGDAEWRTAHPSNLQQSGLSFGHTCCILLHGTGGGLVLGDEAVLCECSGEIARVSGFGGTTRACRAPRPKHWYLLVLHFCEDQTAVMLYSPDEGLREVGELPPLSCTSATYGLKSGKDGAVGGLWTMKWSEQLPEQCADLYEVYNGYKAPTLKYDVNECTVHVGQQVDLTPDLSRSWPQEACVCSASGLPPSLCVDEETGRVYGEVKYVSENDVQVTCHNNFTGKSVTVTIRLVCLDAPELVFPEEVEVRVGQRLDIRPLTKYVQRFRLLSGGQHVEAPKGLHFDYQTGHLSGTPLEQGEYSFTFVAETPPYTKRQSQHMRFTVHEAMNPMRDPHDMHFPTSVVAVYGTRVKWTLPRTEPDRYSVSPPLPSGLNLDDCAITGVPCVLSPQTTYTLRYESAGTLQIKLFQLRVDGSARCVRDKMVFEPPSLNTNRIVHRDLKTLIFEEGMRATLPAKKKTRDTTHKRVNKYETPLYAMVGTTGGLIAAAMAATFAKRS